MLRVIRLNFVKRLISHPLIIWVTVNFNTGKPGTEKKTGIAFYITCVTRYEEVTLQLVSAGELVCERVQ